MQAIDADWISLQYKDPTKEIKATGLNVKHYKRACETDDYDDTAALVAELDFVIGPPTTVIHMAGSIGKETYCLTPPECDWNFQVGLPWYNCVELYRKRKGETWKECLARFTESLRGLRSKTAVGVHGTASLDHQTFNGAGINLPVDSVSTTDHEARAY
jgi:hypothetical protein